MNTEVEFSERDPQTAMAVRVRSAVQDLPTAFDAGYRAIGAYLAEVGVPPVGAPFAIYHTMDMQALDVEMGFPVAGILPGNGDVYAMEIPGGMWATKLHLGPYDQVGPAYEVLMAAVAEKGFAPAGMSCEFYLNEPGTVPIEELQTLVGFPLQAK